MKTHKLTEKEKQRLNALISRVQLFPAEDHPHKKVPVTLPFREGLSLALLRARKKKNEFAEKDLGVNKSRISSYLAGVYSPSYENYTKIIVFCAKWNVKLEEVR
jgi:hypothetical protein